MKRPAFFRTKVSGLWHSSANLQDEQFSEYRATRDFKNVVTVKVRHFGPETKQTKKHDFVSDVSFILDSGNKPTMEQIDLVLKQWQDTFPGVYFYERITEQVIDFSI